MKSEQRRWMRQVQREKPKNKNFTNLYFHLSHHNIKGWLLEGAFRERANTIGTALQRISSRRLAEGLARVLTEQY
jgi:hypothetical protein